LEIRGFFYSKD